MTTQRRLVALSFVRSPGSWRAASAGLIADRSSTPRRRASS
jgi:hypothetical protein